MKKYFVIIVLGLIIWACSSDSSNEEEPQPNLFDRSIMLENWADNIIIPSYQSFSESLNGLETALNTFNTETTEDNLLTFRANWRNAYMLWQRVSMFEIGPAEAADYRLNINTYPTNTSEIETNIAVGNVDLSLPSNRDTKGFPALDYLLNGLADSDTNILARFNSTTEGDNLLNYTRDLIDNMQILTNTVLNEWQNTFRDAFVADDGSSATASVDRYANDYILYYERFLRAGKIGIPAGVFSNSPLPQNLEAVFDGTLSNDLFIEGLDAVQDFFNGVATNSSTNGISFDDYLNALDRDDLTNAINNQFDIARARVNSLALFAQELESNPAVNLLLAYDEVQNIVPLIKVDMLSALNINVDFQDADGD